MRPCRWANVSPVGARHLNPTPISAYLAGLAGIPACLTWRYAAGRPSKAHARVTASLPSTPSTIGNPSTPSSASTHCTPSTAHTPCTPDHTRAPRPASGASTPEAPQGLHQQATYSACQGWRGIQKNSGNRRTQTPCIVSSTTGFFDHPENSALRGLCVFEMVDTKKIGCLYPSQSVWLFFGGITGGGGGGEQTGESSTWAHLQDTHASNNRERVGPGTTGDRAVGGQ